MLSFAKYQGLGNDFLIVDLRTGEHTPPVQSPEAARALCDRRFGVGGDGVLALLAPTVPGADVRMRVLNADGSEAEMCGNGIRCVARYLVARDPAFRGRSAIRVDTLAGVLSCGLVGDEVSVEMGAPRLLRGEIPMVGPGAERCLEQPVPSTDLSITAVSMGNPHAVAFVDETGPALRARAERLGPALETHAWFPRRTNVELARVESGAEPSIELVVWERGCGITLACGTGACATVVAACLTGRATAGRPTRVRLLGGDLTITVAADYSGVTMRGPARHVYDATIDLAALL